LPGWAADLYLAIERLPVSAYHWDDFEARWDDPESDYRWDDFTEGLMVDATCDWSGLEIEVGSDDPEGRVDASRLVATIRNDDGQWSQYDSFGRLIAYEPGSKLMVWADDGQAWWLFSGIVVAWRELPDGTIEVEAFDAASDLNESIGEWLPGVWGQRPETRIAAILTQAGYSGPSRLDPGQVTLSTAVSTATPWEELQAVALSDGGFVGVDVDGTVIFRNRSWPGGRADQTGVRAFTDNVCDLDAGLNVWDLTLLTDDEVTVTALTLTNMDQVTVHASTPAPRAFTDARSGDQWITAADGRALAAAIVARRSQAYVRVEEFALHLIDPLQDLWRAGIDLRIGDLVRLVHDQPAVDGPNRIDLLHAVQRVRHDITPDAWLVTVGTTRAVGNNVLYRWDGTGLRWDQTDTLKWGY
jgi:hypothetical protein